MVHSIVYFLAFMWGGAPIGLERMGYVVFFALLQGQIYLSFNMLVSAAFMLGGVYERRMPQELSIIIQVSVTRTCHP